MGLFFKASRKELLELRNKIFLEKGVPALYNQGFVRSPFSTDWFGRNNLKDFTYTLCRMPFNSRLEIVTVHISRGDKWVKIFLNMFDLKPDIDSLDILSGWDGMQFALPPNSRSKMRLRINDIKGIPFFPLTFGKQHKIGRYWTKRGLNKNAKKLGDLIQRDMTNIDSFVQRWLEMHRPNLTTWKGLVINKLS